MKTLLIRLDEKLHKDFKTCCAATGTDMNKQILAMMIAYVAKHGNVLPAPKERGK